MEGTENLRNAVCHIYLAPAMSKTGMTIANVKTLEEAIWNSTRSYGRAYVAAINAKLKEVGASRLMQWFYDDCNDLRQVSLPTTINALAIFLKMYSDMAQMAKQCDEIRKPLQSYLIQKTARQVVSNASNHASALLERWFKNPFSVAMYDEWKTAYTNLENEAAALMQRCSADAAAQESVLSRDQRAAIVRQHDAVRAKMLESMDALNTISFSVRYELPVCSPDGVAMALALNGLQSFPDIKIPDALASNSPAMIDVTDEPATTKGAPPPPNKRGRKENL